MDHTSLLLCSRVFQVTESHTTQTGRRRRALFVWLQGGAPVWSVRAVCMLLGDYGPPATNDDPIEIGLTEFRMHEKHHRLHGPALFWTNGTQLWYKHGKLHREGDLPAFVTSRGTHMWYKNDKLHRDGKLPAVIRADGRREWWKHGKRENMINHMKRVVNEWLNNDL